MLWQCWTSGALTMSDARGYSYAFVKRVQAADKKLIGVRLGLICVERNIPVATVAKALGSTRQTVYSWFDGTFQPRPAHVEKIAELLTEYAKSRV